MAPGRLDENSPWRYSFPLQQRPLETVPLRPTSSLPTIFSPSAVVTTRPLKSCYPTRPWIIRAYCPFKGPSENISRVSLFEPYLNNSSRTETLRVAMSVWQLISHQTVPQLVINSHDKLAMN